MLPNKWQSLNLFDDDEQIIHAMVNPAVVELTAKTGFEIIQTNGQRVYARPGDIRKPGKGCEIFVGKIPRDMFEDEIVPIFERIGPVLRCRIMMDFSGKNRGYGFISYLKPEVAGMAVSLLHGYEIRPGRHIGVYKSLDNCRLFVGGIPIEKSKEDVWDALAEYVDGIKNVIMYQAHVNKKHNRGFVFVEFFEHKLAAMARRKLSPGSLVLWGVPILVDWADPVPDVDPEIATKLTKLYIRNLDIELSTAELWSILNQYVPDDYIIKTHKILDYAFVHFIHRKAAEESLELLQGVQINGVNIDIEWARPRDYSKTNRMLVTPNHYCTSLPPRLRKNVQIQKGRVPSAPFKLVESDVNNSATISSASLSTSSNGGSPVMNAGFLNPPLNWTNMPFMFPNNNLPTIRNPLLNMGPMPAGLGQLPAGFNPADMFF